MMNTKYKDRTGERHGRLLVLGPAESRRSSDGKPRRYWRCLCDCGNTIDVRSDSLENDRTKSCGCLQRDAVSEYMREHPPKAKYGESRERLHNIWYLMNYRCEEPTCSAYKNYGGRGILVCKEWKDVDSGYQRFKEWALQNGYSDELTIDRIDNNGNYEPSNCRWVDTATQSRNKRSNVRYVWNGAEFSIAELSQMSGIRHATLWQRIRVLHWDVEKALTTPVRK